MIAKFIISIWKCTVFWNVPTIMQFSRVLVFFGNTGGQGFELWQNPLHHTTVSPVYPQTKKQQQKDSTDLPSSTAMLNITSAAPAFILVISIHVSWGRRTTPKQFLHFKMIIIQSFFIGFRLPSQVLSNILYFFRELLSSLFTNMKGPMPLSTETEGTRFNRSRPQRGWVLLRV